jgi:hypothetical protein
VLAVAAAALWAAPGAFAAGWCGSGVQTPDRPDAVTGAQVHAVYATPSDGPDNFATYASALADDADAIDAWWRTQDPTRELRFDVATFPTCVGLDVTFARLPRTGEAIAAAGSGAYNIIVGTLSTLGYLHPFKRYLVYYDGPPFRSSICGTSAGRFERGPSTSIVWLNACKGAPRDYVAAHEILHALGAVPDGAPNTCRRDPGHVCDAPNDIMQPEVSGLTLSEEVLDAGHDDYYGHSGSWPDIQDSAWLRRLDRPQTRLSIALQGAGRVTSDLPGIDCTASCATDWDAGSLVTLTADGAATTRFVRWRGACSGADDCVVSTDASKTALAVFGPRVISVKTSVAGRGRVACSPRCSGRFPAGATLTLRAVAAKGWAFSGWSGACKGKAKVCRPSTDFGVAARAAFRRASV